MLMLFKGLNSLIEDELRIEQEIIFTIKWFVTKILIKSILFYKT